MAEETLHETTTTTITTTTSTTTEDMVIETLETASIPKLTADSAANDDSQPKRAREDESKGDGVKKQKLEEDKSVEEERLEKIGVEEKDVKKSDSAIVGPKSFDSSVEMFNYFYKFLHFWAPNVNINKYEHLMLLDLLKKGHAEPEKKIGSGIQSFQVRYHPMWKSRCFFLVRKDESVDDFSFRKCVDQILPLPEDLKIKPEANKALGGGRGGKGGRGGGHGRGRGGGKWRN